MSEPLRCEERGGFCAVRTLSERCQNTVRTLSERCQNGQVSVRTGVGAPQTRFPASERREHGAGGISRRTRRAFLAGGRVARRAAKPGSRISAGFWHAPPSPHDTRCCNALSEIAYHQSPRGAAGCQVRPPLLGPPWRPQHRRRELRRHWLGQPQADANK